MIISVTQMQEWFATCSDMDESGGVLVIATVPAVDRFGWTTLVAVDWKRTLLTVDIAAGAHTTVGTVVMFQFHASQRQLSWLAVPVHEKDVLKCNITAPGEPCVMIISMNQTQEWFATCSDMETWGDILFTATVTEVDRFG